MGYFILRKNLNETVNNYLTLINNSVSQQVYEYSPQSGEKKANGFIYRPALRMQFVPYLRLGSSNENHYFYPSKLKIMKKEDYWVDFDYRNPNQNGKIKFRKFTKNTIGSYDIEKLQLYNGYQLSDDSVVGDIFDLNKKNGTLEVGRKNKYNQQFPQSGVIFQQVIPYQKLNFQIRLVVSTENIIDGSVSRIEYHLVQQINVYTISRSEILYKGRHSVLYNNQTEKYIDLQNILTDAVNFLNGRKPVADIEVALNAYIDNLTYDNMCQIYYYISHQTNDTTDLNTSFRSNKLYATSFSNIENYKKTLVDFLKKHISVNNGNYEAQTLSYTYQQELSDNLLQVFFNNFNSKTTNVSTQYNESEESDYSDNSIGDVNNIFTQYNSSQFNYSPNTYSLFGQDDCQLGFYSSDYSGQRGTWLYNKFKDDVSYFTRSKQDSTTSQFDTVLPDINTKSNASQAIQQTANFIRYSSTNYNTNSFIVNKTNQTYGYRKYTLYWDYLKKNQFQVNGVKQTSYACNDIQKYFNEEVLFTVEFSVWNNNTSGQAQYDNSVHYQYAFSYIEDKYMKSTRPIVLINYQYDNETSKELQGNDFKYRQFLINSVENKPIANNDVMLSGDGFSKFINTPQMLYCNVAQSETQNIDSLFYKIRKYRYAQKAFLPDDSDADVKWHQIDQFVADSVDNANAKIIFEDIEKNSKQIWLQIADNQFNYSKVVNATMTVYTQNPSAGFIKIIGSNGSQNYTGIVVDSQTGQFSIDNSVQVQFSASTSNDDVQLFYKITGDIYDEYVQKDDDGNLVVRKWSQYKKFSNDDNLKKLYLTTSKYSYGYYSQKRIDDTAQYQKQKLVEGCLDCGSLKQIVVTFRDSAGNILSDNTTSKTIYLNTVLFQAQNKNLRQTTASYDLQLYKNANGNPVFINRSDSAQSTSYRKWNDIFYPENHGYPTLADGTIDEQQAIRVSQAAKNSEIRQKYDAVTLVNGGIKYDVDGRVETEWDTSKKYPTMVSTYRDLENKGTGLTYWIIDNTGQGDIQLTFQHFNLDNVGYGPPYNQMMPQHGAPDCLAVYDASAQGCVTQITNQLGQTEYVLNNTTVLQLLQIYTGYGQKTMSLKTGTVNASAQGAFTTQKFGTQRICLVFYSDSMNSSTASNNPIGSGFKIKASKKIVQYWQNFDVDTTNGLIWVHLSNNIDGVQVAGQTLSKAYLTYQYYNTSLKIDYQQGSVIFDVQPQGDVFANYIYYDYEKQDVPPSRDFMANSDDMVDYSQLNVYFVNRGVTPIKTQNTQTPLYPTLLAGQQQPSYNDGKLNYNYSTDKDRGIIQFNDATGVSSKYNQFTYVPRGRLFADYRYHTFDRLANDGYSDFQFNDAILVADRTTKYPDYTWGDIKIVNQGDASLQAGEIKFLARGVITDGVVTQVLDINRPWDVQSGTAQQTYGKTACLIKKNYQWNSYSCTRQQAKLILNNSNRDRFNVDQLQPKGILYGRIVICLGGANDSYPTTTAGKKVFSSQIAGKYYQQE